MKILSVSQLNALAQEGQPALLRCDSQYSKLVKQSAEQIARNADQKPIVLLSGPSGSGKTTTAHMLEAFLDNMGFEAHTVSMDNYFYRRADGTVPLDDEGNHDFESPDNLDIALFKEQVQKMAAGIPVDMPTFDFANQRRGSKTIPLHRKKGEIIIFEGIHALNPYVLSDHSFCQMMYISVRTRVSLQGELLHPSLVRLLRRLMRDKTHRASSFSDTVARYKSVSRGEKLFIDPYKTNADISIDTFCPYELNVYRDLLLPELEQVDAGLLRETGADKAIEVLLALDPINSDTVSEHSLIQEFLAF